MTTDENILSGNYLHATIWQQSPNGVPEPALAVRDYADDLIGIRQGNSEILVNKATVPELCRLLKKFAAHTPKSK